MRTAEEIVQKIDATKNDFFGFGTGVLLSYLPFEHLKLVKGFKLEDVTPEKWAADGFPCVNTREAILKELSDYMKFAWGATNGCEQCAKERQPPSWTVGRLRAALSQYTDDQEIFCVLDNDVTTNFEIVDVDDALCKDVKTKVRAVRAVLRLETGD